MKRIYYILCIAMLVTACKREDKSAKLIEEYQALNDRVSEQLKEVESPEVADSIINVFIDEAFALQQAQPESEAAYVILSDLFYMLSMEQKEQAFAILNPDSLEAHELQRAYDAFQAEKKTAVGLTFTDFNIRLPARGFLGKLVRSLPSLDARSQRTALETQRPPRHRRCIG